MKRYDINNYDIPFNDFSPYIKIDYRSKAVLKSPINYKLKIAFKANSFYQSNLATNLSVSFNAASQLEMPLYKKHEVLSELVLTAESRVSINLKSTSLRAILMILSPDFDVLSFLETYQDFVWNYRWRNVDNFEVSISKFKDESKFLITGNYIAVKRGEFVKAGKIKDRELTINANGEFIKARGKGLGEIFENRIAFNGVNEGNGYDSFSGPAESAMKHYVNVNVQNPNDIRRKVQNLIIEDDRHKGRVINYRARFQKLSEILYDISKISGLGWDLVLDLKTKEIIFKVLKAKIRKGIIFSPNFDSITMLNYKESSNKNENTALVAGQGEGAERMLLEVNRNEV